MQERIKEIIEALSGPLTTDQAADGWSDRSKKGISVFFEKLLEDLSSARPVAYIGVLRSLDTWGVQGGDLYDKIIRVTNELNAKRR